MQNLLPIVIIIFLMIGVMGLIHAYHSTFRKKDKITE